MYKDDDTTSSEKSIIDVATLTEDQKMEKYEEIVKDAAEGISGQLLLSIHDGPGTGKTSILVEQVLVCIPISVY